MAFFQAPNLIPMISYIALYVLFYLSTSLLKSILPTWVGDIISIVDTEDVWAKMSNMFSSFGHAAFLIGDMGLAVYLSFFYFRLFEFNLWNNRYDRAGTEGFLRTAYRQEIVEKDQSHFESRARKFSSATSALDDPILECSSDRYDQYSSQEIGHRADLGFNTLLFHMSAYVALWLPPIFVDWLGIWCFPMEPLVFPTAITHCRMLFEGSKAIHLFLDTKVQHFITDANRPAENVVFHDTTVVNQLDEKHSDQMVKHHQNEKEAGNGIRHRRRLLSPIGASTFSEVPLTICVAVMDFLIIPAIARHIIALLFGRAA